MVASYENKCRPSWRISVNLLFQCRLYDNISNESVYFLIDFQIIIMNSSLLEK